MRYTGPALDSEFPAPAEVQLRGRVSLSVRVAYNTSQIGRERRFDFARSSGRECAAHCANGDGHGMVQFDGI